MKCYPPNAAAPAAPARTVYVNGAVDLESEVSDIYDPNKISKDLPTYIRHGFIRKVYAIVTAQLSVTIGLAIIYIFCFPTSFILKNSVWVILTAGVLAAILVLVLVCVPKVGNKTPLNHILFTCISICYGFFFGALGSFFSKQAFLMALGTTFAVVVALTLFACQTKFDFTGCAPYLIIIVVPLIIFGICASLSGSHKLHMLYGILGTMVFSLAIVIDTQMILGGKHKYEYSLDEYVFAALSLYIDIINLFLYILMLFGDT